MKNSVDNATPKVPWFYGTASVIFSLILFGPLAFPLLWKSPRFSRKAKIILTLFVTLATIYMVVASWQMIVFIMDQFKQAGLM